MKTAIALDTGFYGGHRVRKGQKFQVSDDAKGKWFQVLDTEKPAKEPKLPAGTKTPTSGAKPPADDLA